MKFVKFHGMHCHFFLFLKSVIFNFLLKDILLLLQYYKELLIKTFFFKEFFFPSGIFSFYLEIKAKNSYVIIKKVLNGQIQMIGYSSKSPLTL